MRVSTIVGLAILTALTLPASAAAETYVLIVGIDEYRDKKIKSLRFAENDARAVAKFYRSNLASPARLSNVRTLLGPQADRKNVLRAITEHLVRRAVERNDTAILYFVGHGFADADDSYLACYDTERAFLAETALTMSQLERSWSRVRGRRVVMVDACHMGSLGNFRGPGAVVPRVRSTKKVDEHDSAWFAASAESELSVEDPKVGHGVFTFALVNGLRGEADADQSGTVTVSELKRYLDKRVPGAARRAGGRQSPVIVLRGEAAQLLLTRERTSSPQSAEAAAGLEAKRKAAEAERDLAEKRRAEAEARLRQLVREGEATQAELAAARAEARAAKATVAQLNQAEQERAAAERRATEAEAEAAALRKQLEKSGRKQEGKPGSSKKSRDEAKVAVPLNEKARTLYARGLYYFKSGYYFRASEMFRTALLEQPTSAELKIEFGLSLFAVNKFSYAAYAVRRGVSQLKPGEILKTPITTRFPTQESYRTELKQLERFVEQRPRDQSSLWLLAFLLAHDAEEDPRLAELLQRLSKLDPDDPLSKKLRKAVKARTSQD